ncbi:MAG: sigma-70 family RNA polymerase sigma factor [Solirubrobacteraceae bacterium]|nr:sigma-70 family RNA polymerase sigma factor [Solirubrobacteraceae bacterium]
MLPFQQVLDRHRDTVWRVCVATAGRQDAEDAFQEAWLAALRAYPRLPEDANVEAWLVTIAHRKAIDVHRARARRPVPSDTLPERAAAPAPAPAEKDALWAAVRALPPGQRAAITLRYAADLRPIEVAEALGISPEAARRRIADGLKSLRQEVQPA